MRSKVKFSVVVLALASAIVAYFGASFLVADYVDVGDSCPSYLLRYRIGSRSLHGLATIFEPARRIDESVLRRRRATVMDIRLAGETER